jgi:DMSO/TMAO reductase YedYZ molybdopterin-dependent catalytic subunit
MTPFIMHSMSPGGSLKDTFPDTEDLVTGWGTVTRGNPPAHLLPTEELPAAGLTEATWFVDIDADPFVEHPHVRSPTEVQTPVRLDLAGLRALGEVHGTVKVMKAMQCLNVQQPLGQGVWEGVPLSTVLRQCGRITNCRRIYYWGYHNNDERQVFRSSISYTEAFEPVPGEPPVMLAFKLNGKPLPLIRGGPVRLIVPHGYGFKNVKFLQHIRLTNDYRANDTYAAIDEGEEGNDPAAVQKTYTTTDTMIGAEKHQHGTPILLSGVLMNGRTKCSHLEYWVRGPFAEGGAPALNDDDPELLAGPWVLFELPPPPASLDGALPGGIAAGSEVFAVGSDGVPEQWPLPFGYSSWSVEVGRGLARGRYEIRARAVDIAGNAQPQPRPLHKNGRNSINCRHVQVL